MHRKSRFLQHHKNVFIKKRAARWRNKKTAVTFEDKRFSREKVYWSAVKIDGLKMKLWLSSENDVTKL